MTTIEIPFESKVTYLISYYDPSINRIVRFRVPLQDIQEYKTILAKRNCQDIKIFRIDVTVNQV